jgi:hypothetical protein
MQINVNEQGQLNVEIINVVANNMELDKLRAGLSCEFTRIEDLTIKFDRESKQGRHHTVRFVLPGPILYQDQRLIDLLHSISLVRWSVDAQPSPKGEPSYF